MSACHDILHMHPDHTQHAEFILHLAFQPFLEIKEQIRTATFTIRCQFYV